MKLSESKEQSESEAEGTQADSKLEPAAVNTTPVEHRVLATAPASPFGKSQSNEAKEGISVVSGPSTDLSKSETRLEEREKEEKRFFSETRRMLQLHHEHAMTLAELVEKFKEEEDPSLPTAEELYQLLTKFNAREGSSGSAKILQVRELFSLVIVIHTRVMTLTITFLETYCCPLSLY